MSQSEDLMVQFGERLIQSFDSTSDFVIAQAPDVVQQLIAYTLVSTALGILFGIASAIVGVICFKQLSNPPSRADAPQIYDYSGLSIGYAMPRAAGVLIFFLTGFIVALELVPRFILVTMAPKVFILKYASALIN